MKCYFRTSDGGYNKVKPIYVNPTSCFRNFMVRFGQGYDKSDITLICDNVKDESWEKLKLTESVTPLRTNAGSSAGGFNLALDLALKNTDENEIIYFVENDFIHCQHSKQVMEEAFNELGADYVTLYDHPDKYLPSYEGGETTKVFNTKSCHWKMTISTTMTFAARLKTLREDEKTLRFYTQGSYPQDHMMFTDLRSKGKVLVSPIPGYSTHGETAWLSPHRDWDKIIIQS